MTGVQTCALPIYSIILRELDMPKEESITSSSQSGSLIALADVTGVAKELCRLWSVSTAGNSEIASEVIPVVGDKERADFNISSTHSQVHVDRVDDYEEMLQWHGARTAGSGMPLMAVTQLWPLDLEGDVHLGGETNATEPKAAGSSVPCCAKLEESSAIVGTLHVVQALLRIYCHHAVGKLWPRLCVVTRGAYESQDKQRAPPSPSQATAVGMARAIEAEVPELDCVCIDLEPGVVCSSRSLPKGQAEMEARFVAHELSARNAREQMVCMRRGKRLVGRLGRAFLNILPGKQQQIGRASCRERV